MTPTEQDRERARAYAHKNAADLADPISVKWLEENGVRYVIPWRIKDQAEFADLLAAVREEAERNAWNAARAKVSLPYGAPAYATFEDWQRERETT